MFKGRIGLWVIMLAVTLLVSWLIPIVPGWFDSNTIYVEVDMSSDAEFAQTIANQKIKKIIPVLTDENPDIIITDSQKEITGYTKYEDYISSPIIAWACGVAYKSTGFIQVPGTNNIYKLDLLTVLEAMEADKKWEDLGFHKSVINGPVTLYIPSPQCAYYNDVIELFMVTLNNGQAVPESNREQLQQRVEAILTKCHMVADIAQAICDEYKEPSETHKIFIGPEYIYKRSRDNAIGYGSDNNKQYRPVYFLNTVFVKANIFTKNESQNVKTATRFVEEMRTQTAFMSRTGWRVKNIEYSIWEVSSVYYKTP